ncbi:hypothetical protein [Chloroflexus aggregans]|uniref:Uncharacterized protein n=1 Tax=Chloroflexus aggregans (strain MD-66 / DSM 9485) TaxID=326427 RepID=B8G8F9_CHLAD|nr:hypothetical protein [Chloroflexus aggregans]ACL24221.1 hypothetical protein Cagg_1313 [Chloroflexus aggregans DSM 9485]
MRFVNDPELMIDEKTSGFLQKIKDNDYELYEEETGSWKRVQSIVQFLWQKRFKGLRKRALFTVILGDGDVLLRDRQSLVGDIDVMYELIHGNELLCYKPDEISQMVFGDLKKKLRSMVRHYNTADFSQEHVDILEQIEGTVDGNGYRLSVKTAQVVELIGRVQAIAQANVAAQKVYDEHQLSLEQRRQRDQIKIEIERLLGVEKLKLELQAEHIRRIRLIDAEMAEKEQRRLLEKIQSLLSLPPELIPAAISLIDPNSASSLAQILAAHASREQFEKLIEHFSPSPRLPSPMREPPMLQVLQDPIVTKIREIAGVRDVRKQNNDYLISFDEPSQYIKLQLSGNKVIRVLVGTTPNPTRIWNGDLSGDVVNVIQRVITYLRGRKTS